MVDPFLTPIAFVYYILGSISLGIYLCKKCKDRYKKKDDQTNLGYHLIPNDEDDVIPVVEMKEVTVTFE
tara:strand:+ start:173 stop:379 length:207 start_codon:yes stop_codon:yes gene_type:complete